ncbi:MAG TPA: DUF4365 domain-containing protein, partial [Verrucomicrobiae bacterium]|nr:DUF4365 domain-containing protein [Verrucomicrobiae bacterium]
MASQLSPRDKTGQRGENVVKYLMDQMSPHSTFLPAGQKTPSIDGTLQLFDPDHKCHRYINVQVKSGDSHVQGRWGSKGVKLRLDLADIRNWKKANIPTIVVWVPGDETKMEAYWRNAQFAKLTLTGVKLKASNKLDKSAFAPLLRLAREHAGVLTTPVISSVPLYPKKVGDVKQIAWNFCLDWRKNGSRNPLLKDIKITLKGWRHLTRPKLSQRLICHKLSLLPCAQEIIETSRQ